MKRPLTVNDGDQTVVIDLKDPYIAGFWAWLWPGAGHLYQGRTSKGILLMVCILSAYFFGLFVGGGHVVYASWTKEDRRLQYLCQVGVGLPALPALAQSYRVFVAGEEPFFHRFMAPPRQPVIPDSMDQKSQWHEALGYRWEMGELYTMVAGLLNILAIFDAISGPMGIEEKKKKTKSEGGKRKAKHGGAEEEIGIAKEGGA